MRVRSFKEMMLEYGKDELDLDDQLARKEKLAQHPFSFIVEAGHLELDSLNNWIKTQIGTNKVVFEYYGKIGYDFGFAEYFFETHDDAVKAAEAVPHIYTIYSHYNTPYKALRSIGYEDSVECDPSDKKAIIFDPLKEV